MGQDHLDRAAGANDTRRQVPTLAQLCATKDVIYVCVAIYHHMIPATGNVKMATAVKFQSNAFWVYIPRTKTLMVERLLIIIHVPTIMWTLSPVCVTENNQFKRK